MSALTAKKWNSFMFLGRLLLYLQLITTYSSFVVNTLKQVFCVCYVCISLYVGRG